MNTPLLRHELNPDCRAAFAASPQRTIIVLGAPQSGTSVAAGALHHLGVFMGAALSRHYEDWAFSIALGPRWGPWDIVRSRADINQLATTVRCRNASFDVWGYKRPGDCRYLEKLEPELRNPAFLVPTRSLLDCAFSAQKNRDAVPHQALLAAARQQERILAFLTARQHPALLFEYETALENKDEFIRSLCDFFALQPSRAELEQAHDFIGPGGGYRAPDNAQIEGFIDQVEEHVLSGWGCDRSRPEQPIRVQLVLDGSVVAEQTASSPRPDVQAAGKHPTGLCGFRLELGENEGIKLGQEVRVVDATHGVDLHKSRIPFRPGIWNRLGYARARVDETSDGGRTLGEAMRGLRGAVRRARRRR